MVSVRLADGSGSRGGRVRFARRTGVIRQTDRSARRTGSRGGLVFVVLGGDDVGGVPAVVAVGRDQLVVLQPLDCRNHSRLPKAGELAQRRDRRPALAVVVGVVGHSHQHRLRRRWHLEGSAGVDDGVGHGSAADHSGVDGDDTVGSDLVRFPLEPARGEVPPGMGLLRLCLLGHGHLTPARSRSDGSVSSSLVIWAMASPCAASGEVM